MSSQSNYVRIGAPQRNVRQTTQHLIHEHPHSNRHVAQFYHSQASTSSPDSGKFLGAREMGPPPSFPSDFPTPPQPIEIEMNSSRTLPNPTASSSTAWDNFSSPGYGQFPDFGPPNVGRPVDGQVRGSAPDPIEQWYTGNDGPWIPKGISMPSEERLHSRVRAGNRMPLTYVNQYRRPNPSDAGSFQYGVAPSDSGYGTRHSDGNASVFSADINDRDQDCQSMVGHIVEYQPFQGPNADLVQPRDSRVNNAWTPIPNSSPLDISLVCPTCQKPLKTKSELKKHDYRHRKPFLCKYPGCTRTDGFSTTNDLDRHTKSKHPLAIPLSEPTKRFRCHVQGCKSKEKSWPRLDNFRSHLKRVHSQVFQTEEDFENMIRRAEYMERTGQTTGQEGSPSQGSSHHGPSRAVGPAVRDSLLKVTNAEPNWKSVYPAANKPAPGLLLSKEPVSERQNESSTPDSNGPALDVQSQKTVQLLEVFQTRAKVQNNPSSLGSILSPPVDAPEPAGTSADRVASQAPVRPSKISPQGKATRLNEVSASEATEAIITALAEAEVPEESKSCSLQQDLDQGALLHGNFSGGSFSAGLNSATPPAGKLNGHIDLPAGQEDFKSLQEKKAREVLKTLRDLGYIVQKDPSHCPKAQNPGSAASNKSENIFTCEVCKRFKGRPCELKKHMKRHSRPYGCTFLTCNKTFGSKNDWKRHENSQHFHLETWRCNAEKLEGGTCAKVCYRRQSFQDHLKKDHNISDAEVVKEEVENCRIGRNCQERFWCGFCTRLIDLKKKGVDAWTERFDHIDDHFMGRRDFPRQGIQDWIPVDSDKPKGDVESQSPPGNESQGTPSDHSSSESQNGHSPEASGATIATPANVLSVDDNAQSGSKRNRSKRDDDSRSAKHQKTVPRRETLVICCQCEAAHNPKLDSRCTVCEDSHQFCNNCTHYATPQDKAPDS